MLRALVLVVLAVVSVPATTDRPHVYVVVVDGLDARFVTPASMPVLFAPGVRTTLAAQAGMPTRTNPGHASLLTGAYPAAHGVTGNAYWRRQPDAAAEKLDDPHLIDVETLFTVAETDDPALVTMATFAKPKLGRLFSTGPAQRPPDVLWVPERGGPGVDRLVGYADDATTMAALLERSAAKEPDLLVANLADVDRNAHGSGPASPERSAAVSGANAALQRLVDALVGSGRWDRSIVLVTADHGFDDVAPTAARPEPWIVLGPALARAGVTGVRTVADGGVAHVYAETLAADAGDVGAAAPSLARAAEVARTLPGVAEVVARLPVPSVSTLAAVHPDWRLAHQRAGELVLVAQPGWQFIEEDEVRLRGNHGGPGERTIPLAVLGGHPAAARIGLDGQPTLADVGATVAELLGIRRGRLTTGEAVPDAARGRSLLAPSGDYKPH